MDRYVLDRLVSASVPGLMSTSVLSDCMNGRDTGIWTISQG